MFTVRTAFATGGNFSIPLFDFSQLLLCVTFSLSYPLRCYTDFVFVTFVFGNNMLMLFDIVFHHYTACLCLTATGIACRQRKKQLSYQCYCSPLSIFRLNHFRNSF